MTDAIPTNPQEEAAQGRIALWLAAEDLGWLARHCCCPEDASPDEKDRCSRLRFRASTALYKRSQSH
ncbi:hypothetical protein BSL84_34080 [Streptomyces sp. TN58]|nr:hypothetical protein BSL84_00425 [Streptomyces sp. TN58]APU44934.1 hypothetical protein BSL84_34080 [Streptomyces sp. TN58]